MFSGEKAIMTNIGAARLSSFFFILKNMVWRSLWNWTEQRSAGPGLSFGLGLCGLD
jgi:hypothetical protein